ncbi:MAG: serine/threonine protein kinase, partial [Pyrinomonadaceae bacterium]
MKFDDWSRVETIYHTALEKDGAERDNYVFSACKGDEILEGEVRSLIDAYESQPDFLDEPVRDLGLLAVSDESQASLTGETIGTYKIGKRLGKGGMGDVYLADDLKLDRQVAVKFLTAAFLNDKWAKRQLMHEAQAVAKLDHKNVCLVYGFENVDEHCFIVMQYIRGESLSNLIKAGTLESDSFQEIAEQIV